MLRAKTDQSFFTLKVLYWEKIIAADYKYTNVIGFSNIPFILLTFWGDLSQK